MAIELKIEQPPIKGGYYIKARCISESWIAHSAPVVRETWDYLLREANHKERKYNGHVIGRGQLFRSYNDIREALVWIVGNSRRRYSVDQVKHTVKLLVKHAMITTANTPRGSIITICKYDYYQNPKNYESTSQSLVNTTANTFPIPAPSPSINKNVKELKELKETNPLNGKVQEIFNLWNKYAVNGIPKVIKLTKSRKEQITVRLREEPDIDYWVGIFSKLQKIPFYCGDNDRGWYVSLDYVMKNDTNHVKIAEKNITNNDIPRKGHDKVSL